MARTRTAEENCNWWLRQMERYQRQALFAKTEKDKAHWLNRASLASASAIACASSIEN